MKPFIACTLSLLILIFAASVPAVAASLPGTVQPGQIEQQFRPEPEMRTDPAAPMTVPEPDQPMPVNAEEIRAVGRRLGTDQSADIGTPGFRLCHRFPGALE